MKIVILFLSLIIIFSVSITLGAYNNQLVEFNYLISKVECRLSTLLAILFGAGFIIGWLLTGFFLVRVKLKLNATQRKLRKVQKQHDEDVANQKKEQLTSL